jgi:hypothetical protein
MSRVEKPFDNLVDLRAKQRKYTKWMDTVFKKCFQLQQLFSKKFVLSLVMRHGEDWFAYHSNDSGVNMDDIRKRLYNVLLRVLDDL